MTARRRYQVAHCPVCGSGGLTLTAEEVDGARAARAASGDDDAGWRVVGAECAHGCDLTGAPLPVSVG